MALLNWGGRYDLSTNKVYKNSSDTTGTLYVGLTSGDDYLKLLFTNAVDGNTGHIITHGIDYTPDYDGTHRGFVPAYDSVEAKANSLLFGDASWRKITVADLPMVAFTTLGNATQYTDDKLFSALSVWNLVDSKIENAFKVNDAMQFIGGIELVDDAWVITSGAGTITTLDSGYTFKASADFDFGSEHVEAGDVLIYTGGDNKAISHEDALNIANWLIIEGNVKNTSEFVVNGTSYHVESQENGTFTIFAPSTAGTKGSILYSTAGTPAWATPAAASIMIPLGNDDDSPRFEALTDGSDFLNGEGKFVDQSTITAGKLYGATTGTSYNAADLFSNFALVNTSEDATGKVKGMTITVGDTTLPVEWSETDKVWDITASAVEKALKVDSTTGIKFDVENGEYTGTEERTLSLLTAANDQFGVIKVDAKKSAEDTYTGKGMTGTDYEGKPTVSMDNGLLYLTKDNVCAALGFEPGNIAEAFQYDIILANAANSITELTEGTANPFINFTSFNEKEGESSKQVTASIQLKGTNAISVVGDNTGVVTIDTPYAFTGIQVRPDANEATALTTLVSASESDRVLELLAGNGISLAHDGTGITINTNLVSSNENHLKLISDANGQITFESIWRDVQINGTSVGVDTNINFVSTPDVIIATASVENEGTTTDEIGFCIAWHNIETGDPELIAPNAISNQA